jgi:hypothetical protein
MKIEAREIFAVIIVFLLPLGMAQLVQKTTLPEYGAAVQVREAIAGVAGGQELCARTLCIAPQPEPHIMVAAALEKAYAAAMGLDAASSQAIAGFLLVFPPVLLAVSAVLLYFACRRLAYSKTQAAFAALMFSLSLLAFISFLPGMYGSSQLAALLLAAFLVAFVAFTHEPSRMDALGGAAVLGFAAGYVNAAFALAALAAAVAFAFAHHGKFRRDLPAVAGESHDTNRKKEGKNYLAMLGALAVVLGASAFLSADQSGLAFMPDGLVQIATGAPFLFAAAAICIGLFFFGQRDSEFLALLVLGALMFGFSPLAGAMLLVPAVAEGVAGAMKAESKEAKLAAAFICAFFVVAGMIYSEAGSPYATLAAGALLGLLAPLSMHFYDYNARGFFAVAGAVLLLLSLFFAAFVQLPPAKQGYPAYTPAGLVEALEYLSGGTSQLYTLDRADAVGFYLPSASIGNESALEKFLVSGNSSLEEGGTLMISLASLESLSGEGGFEIYYYAQNYTNPDSGAIYALFVSSRGRLASRELAPGGKFALKDGAALDSYGRYYAPIALPRMAMLYGSKPYTDRSNRLLVMEEGGAPPRMVGVYSGTDPGATLVKEFDGVSIFRVS